MSLEDLEVRHKLDSFRAERRKETARQELGNAVKILQRLRQDHSNIKLHEMRRDVLEQLVGKDLLFAFYAAGFEERSAEDPSTAAFVWQPGQASEAALDTTFQEAQRAADLCLDPNAVSFAEVSELVQQCRTLPGIEDVDDAVRSPVPPKESSLSRPKKPWQQ